jgi:hypothetical protein
VAVLGAQLIGGSAGSSDDERNLCLAAGHVVDLRGVVDDLIERQDRERHGHHLDDRAKSGHGGSGGDAGYGGLRYGSVYDAPAAVLVEQARGYAKGALVAADILTDQKDVLVSIELFDERLADGVAIGEGGGRH